MICFFEWTPKVLILNTNPQEFISLSQSRKECHPEREIQNQILQFHYDSNWAPKIFT